MGKATGFMDYNRQTAAERDPKKRLNDWNEYDIPLSEKQLREQGARCMDCGTPFCHTGININGMPSGCPVNNLIPEWNDLVYNGDWQEALARLHKTNNFPEFTGRVCPAPCEGSCTVAISDAPVSIKNIEQAIIDRGFDEGWIVPKPPKTRTGKKVAVVGSGPAGLASADQLNKAGHLVTVFERDDRIGGLLMYGIPNMKLDKGIVERRVRLLEDEGVTFQTNTEIGKEVTMEQLERQFDAVIVCTGATQPRDLPIEGRQSKGIHYAMEYLHKTTKSLLDSNFTDGQFIDAKGKDVIVIGGGDTGADCVATALRQKCKSVVQFGRHPKLPEKRTSDNPWPQFPNIFTTDYAYKEATSQFGRDPREFGVLTKHFETDEEGHVCALHTVQIERIEDEQGNYTFEEIAGTEKRWAADLVFIAIGFSGPEPQILDHAGIEKDTRGNARAEFGRYTTNKDGVFAAGDVRRGQSLVVWAIREGREAARECDKYLMGSTRLP